MGAGAAGGAGAFDSRKHPAAVVSDPVGVPGVGGGCVGSCFVVLVVFFPPVGCVGADVPGRRGGGCWCSCRGLLVLLLIIWKNSSRAAAGIKHGNV